MLENRMRRPSRTAPINEESLKSIKSTDSKKLVLPLHKLPEEQHEETPHEHLIHVHLSEEEIKFNRKITDYFQTRPKKIEDSPPAPHEPLPQREPAKQSPPSKNEAEDPGREEVRGLKEALRERDEVIASFRTEIVESTVRLHKIRRN